MWFFDLSTFDLFERYGGFDRKLIKKFVFLRYDRLQFARSLPISRIILQEQSTEQESGRRINASLTFSAANSFAVRTINLLSLNYPAHPQSHPIPFNLLDAHADSFIFA
jgi:hypothetical protein